MQPKAVTTKQTCNLCIVLVAVINNIEDIGQRDLVIWLFNIYMDFVARQAMAQMPSGCWVELAYHADGKLHRTKEVWKG
jgi:hypothetical protein